MVLSKLLTSSCLGGGLDFGSGASDWVGKMRSSKLKVEFVFSDTPKKGSSR